MNTVGNWCCQSTHKNRWQLLMAIKLVVKILAELRSAAMIAYVSVLIKLGLCQLLERAGSNAFNWSLIGTSEKSTL